MSFKSVIEASDCSRDNEKIVHKIISPFNRNDSSDDCLHGPRKIIPENKRLLKILGIINNMYKERVRKTKGIIDDPDLIITIYEEWNENLKKYCLDLIDIMEELKKDAFMQLNALGEKLNTSMFEISKASVMREDRDNLIELIRRTFTDNRGWDFGGLKFHTIAISDIFGEDLEDVICKDNEDSVRKTDMDQGDLTVRLNQKKKKIADILRDNDLLKSEVSCLKRQIKRDADLKNK